MTIIPSPSGKRRGSSPLCAAAINQRLFVAAYSSQSSPLSPEASAAAPPPAKRRMLPPTSHCHGAGKHFHINDLSGVGWGGMSIRMSKSLGLGQEPPRSPLRRGEAAR